MPTGVVHVRSDVVLHDVCCVLARLLTDHVGLLCQYVVAVGGSFVVPAAVRRFQSVVVLCVLFLIAIVCGFR